MKVTVETLRAKMACESQVAIFAAEWPDGCEITLRSLIRAWELSLDLGWFASQFLADPAWAEYRRVAALAWAESRRVAAPAWDECRRVAALALWTAIQMMETDQIV